jgi:hypothetical protein
MALRAAVATGNWSNPAIWNGGVLPSAGDVVASNNFTVTIDQNINVDTLTNAAQAVVGAVPNMTSNTTPSGIVTASQSETGSYAAFNAFGGDFNTEWRPATAATISYEFTSPKAIDQYVVGAYVGATSSWTFQGWNGSTWVTIHTVTSSATGYTSPLLGNSTTYIKYRLNYASDPGRVHTIQFYEYLGTSAAIAGGGFILNGTFTVSATGGGFVTGSTRLLTYTGSNCVLNGNMIGSTTTNVQTVYHDSTGALTINGNVINTANPTVNVIVTNSTGTLNINGNIQGDGRGVNVFVNSVCTVNIVGNLTRLTNFSGGACVQINLGATVNITGISSNNSGGTGSPTIVVNSSSSTLNVTGDVFFAGVSSSCSTITISQPGRVTVVGNVYSTAVLSFAIVSTINGYLSIVGSIYTTSANVAVLSNNASAINLFSGPFVCSTYGYVPLQVVRMHLIPSTNSYFEFRDETTNGAVSPGAVAPATRLVSPATLVSSLAVSDVRFGIVYALSTLTGTLRMPTANQVTFGIPVDATFGNAVLTAASVWDYLVSNITTADSIGMRLKNVATPQTTGEQLEAFLRLD